MIIGDYNNLKGEHESLKFDTVRDHQGKEQIKNVVSNYQPNEKERLMRQQIVKHFTYSDIIFRKPRREFNDLSVVSRTMIDQMAFNAYQPNNGDALEGDELNSWKSRAMRPIVRNKIITMAAHATAQLIFPKVFAYNKDTNSEEAKAAQVMEDLMEWAGERSGYDMTNLYAVLGALINPASIVYTEYGEVYQKYKTEKGEDGEYKWEITLDEDASGFQDTIVPVDELYIANFYEHDIQKQEWLIWRRVQPYSQMNMKYANYEKFKYVKPGVQLIYNDANFTFYEVYDTNLRQEMCEEIIYWNKEKDVKIIMVNGVILTDWDNPNPRQDKQYPFIKFGFELMDEGKCFYYKSLAFKMMQDANIINTLYPMIIDGTYLSLMPPLINTGGDIIGSDVIVPGAITTVGKDVAVSPLQIAQNMTAGLNALQAVEKSINESDQGTTPLRTSNRPTNYEIQVKQQEQMIMVGLFVKMVIKFIKDYGKLRMNDILQYLTIGEASKIEGNELIYKTFLLPNKQEKSGIKTRKLQFDANLPSTPLNENEDLAMSYSILKEQGGRKSDTFLYKANPILFRNLKYTQVISPNAMKPLSEEATRTLILEAYDRFIQNPLVDPEQITKDALGVYPEGKKNPDKYIKKVQQSPMQSNMGQQMVQPQQQLPIKRQLTPAK